MNIDPNLLEACYEEENRTDIVDALYANIKDGMTFVLGPRDCAIGDRHLLFSGDSPRQKIVLHTARVPWWVEYDDDEPLRLEDVPTSFCRTLLKNIAAGNYTIAERTPRH